MGEHRTENSGVRGSIPFIGKIFYLNNILYTPLVSHLPTQQHITFFNKHSDFYCYSYVIAKVVTQTLGRHVQLNESKNVYAQRNFCQRIPKMFLKDNLSRNMLLFITLFTLKNKIKITNQIYRAQF